MGLNEIRDTVDRIDRELVQLLTRRMEVAIRAKRFKEEIRDDSREERVLSGVREMSLGLVSPDFSESLFRLIIDQSRQLQESQAALVAFQGQHGANSEVALKRLHPEWISLPLGEFAEVFDAVSRGAVDYAVVPIDNSLEGAIVHVRDLLLQSDLKIVAEIVLPIRHALMCLRGSDHRRMRDVYSHPNALARCREFLRRNNLQGKPYHDSASAARMLARERISSAAVIASSLCADLYGLEIIKDQIEDRSDSVTRYLVLAKEGSHDNGDKCSLSFALSHQAGALNRVLALFAEAQINLTRIESVPCHAAPARVAFLLDFLGCESDAKVQEVLGQLSTMTSELKVLGFYREHRVDA